MNWDILFHCYICQLLHQCKCLILPHEQCEVMFIISCNNFYWIREQQAVSFCKFRDICPADFNGCFLAKDVGIEAHVMYWQIHPALSWHFAFPIAKKTIWIWEVRGNYYNSFLIIHIYYVRIFKIMAESKYCHAIECRQTRHPDNRI